MWLSWLTSHGTQKTCKFSPWKFHGKMREYGTNLQETVFLIEYAVFLRKIGICDYLEQVMPPFPLFYLTMPLPISDEQCTKRSSDMTECMIEFYAKRWKNKNNLLSNQSNNSQSKCLISCHKCYICWKVGVDLLCCQPQLLCNTRKFKH